MRCNGLNTASMYKEFGDKDGLFEDALAHYREHVLSPRLQMLIDEHATILSNLNEMLEQAKESDAGNQSELLDRVSTLLQQLDGHEQKEHRFAVDILGARADVS